MLEAVGAAPGNGFCVGGIWVFSGYRLVDLFFDAIIRTPIGHLQIDSFGDDTVIKATFLSLESALVVSDVGHTFTYKGYV